MRAVFKARACGRPAAGAAAAVPAPSAWPASAACPRLTRGACLLCSLRGWRSRAGAAQGLHEPQLLRPSCGPHGAAPQKSHKQGTDARRPAAGSMRSAAARRAWCCSRRPSGRRARCASRTWPRMRRWTCPSPTWSEAAPPSLSDVRYLNVKVQLCHLSVLWATGLMNRPHCCARGPDTHGNARHLGSHVPRNTWCACTSGARGVHSLHVAQTMGDTARGVYCVQYPFGTLQCMGPSCDKALMFSVLVPVYCMYRQARTAPEQIQACHYYGCSQHTPNQRPTPIYSAQAARQQYVPCQGSRPLHSAPHNQKECKTGSRARAAARPLPRAATAADSTGNGKQRQQQLAVCLLVPPGATGVHRPSPRRSRKQQPRGARAFTGRACSSGRLERDGRRRLCGRTRSDGAYLE
jgi:hypothetical protein